MKNLVSKKFRYAIYNCIAAIVVVTIIVLGVYSETSTSKKGDNTLKSVYSAVICDTIR